MKRTLFALAAASLAACGSPPPTTTSVTGTVAGVSFSPAFAIYGKQQSQDLFDTGRVFIMISESSTACTQLMNKSFFGRSGVLAPGGGADPQWLPSLYLELGDPASTWRTRGSVGDGVNANLDPGGPEGRSLIAPSLGTVTLDQYDDTSETNARAAGSFTLGFSDGIYTGTFSARPCTQLRPGCSASAGGLSLVALLALLGALRRRRYFFFVQRSSQPSTVSCH